MRGSSESTAGEASWYGWVVGRDQRRCLLSAGGEDCARDGAADLDGEGARTGAERLACPRLLKSRVCVPRLYPPKSRPDGAGLAGRGAWIALPR